MTNKSNKQPMFDLRDCEDISLKGNSTEGKNLLTAENTKRIHAEGNTAGLVAMPPESKANRFIPPAVLKWIVNIASALFIAYILYRLGWN